MDAIARRTRGAEPAGELTAAMVADLAATQGWARLLSAMCWVAVLAGVATGGLLVIGGFIYDDAPAAMRPTGWLMIAGGVFSLPPALWLHRYCAAIARVQRGRSVAALLEALHNERRFWRYAAVVTIGFAILLLVGLSKLSAALIEVLP